MKFLIWVNGSPSNFFESSRGLWHGDLLFPLLFIFVIETHSKMLNRARKLHSTPFGFKSKDTKQQRTEVEVEHEEFDVIEEGPYFQLVFQRLPMASEKTGSISQCLILNLKSDLQLICVVKSTYHNIFH